MGATHAGAEIVRFVMVAVGPGVFQGKNKSNPRLLLNECVNVPVNGPVPVPLPPPFTVAPRLSSENGFPPSENAQMRYFWSELEAVQLIVTCC